jgi:hypothetical protein
MLHGSARPRKKCVIPAKRPFDGRFALALVHRFSYAMRMDIVTLHRLKRVNLRLGHHIVRASSVPTFFMGKEAFEVRIVKLNFFGVV